MGDVGFDRRSLLFGLAAAATASQLSGSSAAQPRDARFWAVSRRSSILRDGVGFLQGRIGRRGPYWFLIDTGATLSAIDSELAQTLSLPIVGHDEVSGSAGTIRTPICEVRDVALSMLGAYRFRATAYDLSSALAPEGSRIAAIIGFDVLHRFRLHYDFAAASLRLAEPHASSSSPWTPIEISERVPRFTALIEQVPVDLRVDTGAAWASPDKTYLNNTTRQLRRLQTRAPSLRPVGQLSATGVGGNISLDLVPVSSVVIAGVALASPVLVVQPEVGYFADPAAVGFVGCYTFHERGGLVVDYPRRRLALL